MEWNNSEKWYTTVSSIACVPVAVEAVYHPVAPKKNGLRNIFSYEVVKSVTCSQKRLRS